MGNPDKCMASSVVCEIRFGDSYPCMHKRKGRLTLNRPEPITRRNVQLRDKSALIALVLDHIIKVGTNKLESVLRCYNFITPQEVPNKGTVRCCGLNEHVLWV